MTADAHERLSQSYGVNWRAPVALDRRDPKGQSPLARVWGQSPQLRSAQKAQEQTKTKQTSAIEMISPGKIGNWSQSERGASKPRTSANEQYPQLLPILLLETVSLNEVQTSVLSSNDGLRRHEDFIAMGRANAIFAQRRTLHKVGVSKTP